MALTRVQSEMAGAGQVLQVVSAVTTTQVTVTNSTYVDSGLTATITPKSATSKILVMVSIKCEVDSSNNLGGNLRLYRGATLIWDGQCSGTLYNYGSTGGAMQISTMIPINYLDSPATTSATTYKVQGALSTGNQFIMQWQSVPSTIVLMEVAV